MGDIDFQVIETFVWIQSLCTQKSFGRNLRQNQATDETIIPKATLRSSMFDFSDESQKIISNKKGLRPVHAP